MKLFSFFSPSDNKPTESTFHFTVKAKVVALWVIIAIGTIFLFRFSKIIPIFIWASVSAYLFNPALSFVTARTRLPRIFWIVVLYLLLGLFLFLAVKAFLPLATNEITDLVNGSLDDPASLLGRIASQGNFSILGFDINVREQVQLFSTWIKTQTPMQALRFFFGAVQTLVFMVIYLIVTFYLLLESDTYLKRIEDLIPHPYKQELSDLFERINSTLGAYIRAQVILIVIMSAASFIVLAALKIKYAFILSLATGILEVIPVAGPILATAIATTVALFQSNVPYGLTNATFALIIIAAYFALRQFEDYFIIPNVVSRFVRVHPLIAIFALLVGGMIGGVLGLFLAIPTAAILKVITKYLYLKLTE